MYIFFFMKNFEKVEKTGIIPTQACINFMAEKNIMIKTEMINNLDEMNDVTEKLNKGNDS